MNRKFIEIRDEATFIPAMAFELRGSDHWLAKAAGYGDSHPYIFLVRLTGGAPGAQYNPHSWGDRTMSEAHRFVKENWDTIQDGDLVDVQFLLGESEAPKASERTIYARAFESLEGRDGSV